MGLFKFALPTFAKDDFWEEDAGGRWKTVPVPPSRLRKNVSRRDVAAGTNGTKKLDVKARREKTDDSVAYVVAILFEEQQSSSLHQRAAVLAASIKKAHEKSSQKYQLYAINYEHSSSTDREKSYTCDSKCREMMIKLGYNMVDVSSSDLDVMIESKYNRAQGSENHVLNGLLKSRIIVHLSLGTFLLKSVDHSLFDHTDEKDVRDISRRQVDLLSQKFVTTNESNNEQLLILRTSSNEATTSYLEYLNCLVSDKKSDTAEPSSASIGIQRRDNWQPTLYPKIRKLPVSAVPKTILKDADAASTSRQCTIKKSNEVLECIYGAASHECEFVVASFGMCSKPWECKKTSGGEGCVKEEQYADARCEWLHRKWFALAKGL